MEQTTNNDKHIQCIKSDQKIEASQLEKVPALRQM